MLGEVLHLFQCKPLSADLTLIGAAGRAGIIQMNKAISKNNSLMLISQSVTGIKERVIDLLSI